MIRCFLLTPKVSRLVTRWAKNLCKLLWPKHGLHRIVIVEKKVLRHQDHRQCVYRPMAGNVVHIDMDLWFGHWSSSPNSAQQVEPVAADHTLYAVGRPTVALHGRGQVRPFADGSQPLGVDDIAEVGQTTGIALVVGDPVEERLAVTLCEIGTDADTILAADIDHVINRLDIIVDIGGQSAL